MLNSKHARMLRRNGTFSPTNPATMGHKCAIMTVVTLLLLLASCALVHAKSPINDRDAILAIIGEGEGESYLGKVMLAYTIINRGTLKGVYGLKAPRVLKRQYAQVTYDQAKKAWEFAKSHPNKGWLATGWGSAADLKVFKRYSWWKHCVVIAKVGNHYFYMERGA